jgi:mannose-6-phosphate isomerase-like protein (cupin superfamily)
VRNMWKCGLAILGVIAVSTVWVPEALAQAKAWTPKPTELSPYVNGHKPLTKVSRVLADKDPSVSWRHQVVDDSSLKAAWVGLKPGDATRTRRVANHQSAFIVWEGSVQVAIDGQTTFTASKGEIIRVPLRNTFTLTNVGSTPSLHFEIFNATRTFIYPADAANSLPPPPQGTVWYQTSENFGSRSQAYSVQGEPVSRNFVTNPGSFLMVDDPQLLIQAIRGMPPPSDPAHFHLHGGEFWFVMEGQIASSIEGLNPFVADAGDIVYVPKGRSHQWWHEGAGFSTAVQISGFPVGSPNVPVNPQPPSPPLDP